MDKVAGITSNYVCTCMHTMMLFVGQSDATITIIIISNKTKPKETFINERTKQLILAGLPHLMDKMLLNAC